MVFGIPARAVRLSEVTGAPSSKPNACIEAKLWTGQEQPIE